MRMRLVPTLIGICALGAWSPLNVVAEEGDEPRLSIRAEAPPVYGLDDFTLLDDRLWTAAVSRRPQLIRTAPAAVEVLTRDDLRQSAAINWADRLRYSAGVDVYQSRHNQYDVGLRGYNNLINQHVLILVDGREFGRSVTGEQYGHWSGFMFMSDIDRVELVKGPSSVTYGANAFGGVISLTGRQVGERPEIHLHSHVGNDGKREVDGTVLAPLASVAPWLKGVDLKVNAGYTESEPRPTVTNPNSVESHPRLGYTDKYDLRSNRQRGIIGYTITEDYRIEAEYAGKHMRDQALVSDLTGVTSQGQFEEHGFGLRLKLPFGNLSHWQQRSTATWSSEYIAYDPTFPGGEGDFYYNQAGFKDRRQITEADFAVDAGDHRLSFGASYLRWRSTSNIWSRDARFNNQSSWVPVTNRTWGLFFEDQWTISPQWSATAGLRYDDDSRVGENWSPRVSLNWLIDDSQFMRLSYSRGYRIPTLIESYIDIYYFESDPDLKAETINAVELGYQRDLVNEDARLNANVHFSRADRMIDWVPKSTAQMQTNWLTWFAGGDYTRTPGPFFDYTNSDNPVTVWGAEVSYTQTFSQIFGGEIELMSNATWQRHRYRDNPSYMSEGFDFGGNTLFEFNQTLPRDINAPPEWKFNVALNYERQWFNAGVAGRYVSSRKIYSFGNTYWLARPDPSVWPSSDDLAVQKVDDYVAFDVHIGIRPRLANSQLWIRAGMMDIFNAARYETYERSEAELVEDLARQYTSEVGRSWFIALDWDW